MAKTRVAAGKAPPANPNEKGPRKVADVPPETIAAIHRGEAETRNLVEALAVDPFVVAQNFLLAIERQDLFEAIDATQAERTTWTLPRAIEAIGVFFGRLHDEGRADDAFLAALTTHRSDVVRSFGCFAVAARENVTSARRLKDVKRFAADRHFGVREFAWLAVRGEVLRETRRMLRELAKWTSSRDANVRRFASEATRPRGVWCRHSDELKREPQLGLPILEPLRADASDYVRLSVGNWLNDASKSRPEFVREICARWRRESPVPQTEAICRRALRSLEGTA